MFMEKEIQVISSVVLGLLDVFWKPLADVLAGFWGCLGSF